MARQVMRRRASDNVYLHRDFHGALSAAIQYLEDRFGEEAVRQYLRAFAGAYYAPLKEALRSRGLVALEEHFRKVYEAEGGEVECRLREEELLITTRSCPAVTHMRARGYPVARLFHETIRTVNEALCEGTPFAAELLRYDARTGAAVMRFRRRAQ